METSAAHASGWRIFKKLAPKPKIANRHDQNTSPVLASPLTERTRCAFDSRANQMNNNNLAGENDKNFYFGLPASHTYLQFEDFSCSGQGLETYQDGRQHPVELRRILTGALSREMSVSFRGHNSENFQALIHPNVLGTGSESSGPEVFSSTGYSMTSPVKPMAARRRRSRRRPFLYRFRAASSPLQQHYPTAVLPPVRKRGRPAAQLGTFDSDSGTIRFVCRLQCGASLASAKGRRKHEKKHCPNLPSASPTTTTTATSSSSFLLGHHSLFSSRIVRVPLKQQKSFDCRVCGKVLKTYEGRRLHEKIQHLPIKQQPEELEKESQLQLRKRPKLSDPFGDPLEEESKKCFRDNGYGDEDENEDEDDDDEDEDDDEEEEDDRDEEEVGADDLYDEYGPEELVRNPKESNNTAE